MFTLYPSPPDLLATIERIRADLPPALQTVAQYVVQCGADLRVLSLDELAKASGVSKATVVRFCQALGYQGFRDFSRALSLASLELPGAVREAAPNKPDSGYQSMPILSKLIASLVSTERMLHTPFLHAAARRIAEAQRIIWYGLGDSGYLAMSADHRCLINGFHSKAVTSSSDMVTLTRHLTEYDVLVCISRSGRLPNLLHTIRHVKASVATQVVVITGDPGSPLAQIADVSLVSAPIDLYVEGQRTTMQTAQMAVLDALIATVLQLEFDTVQTIGSTAPHLSTPEGGDQ